MIMSEENKELLTLEEAKLFLRIDDSFTEDDALIGELIVLADGQLEDGISNYEKKKLNDKFKAKAKMCMRLIVQNLYDERTLVTLLKRGETVDLSYTVRTLMMQMEYGDYNV